MFINNNVIIYIIVKKDKSTTKGSRDATKGSRDTTKGSCDARRFAAARWHFPFSFSYIEWEGNCFEARLVL